MNNSFHNFLPVFNAPWVFATFTVFQLVAIVWLAVAVKKDADLRVYSKDGVFLNASWPWFPAVVATGGHLAALAYWLIHYSSLRGRRES